MPATGHIGENWNPRNNFFLYDSSDKLFVQILNTYGFGGCYITDVVKTCTPAGDLDEDDVKEFKNILEQEIKIIQPRLIVAVGGRSFRAINNKKYNFDFSSVPIYEKPIYLPVNLRLYPHRIPIFEEQVKKLRSFCNAL